MKPPANCFLLGTPGRLPFLGHFRLRVFGENCQIDLCGRIGQQSPPEEAWILADRIAQALAQAEGGDGPSLMRDCWEKVLTFPRNKLGTDKGTNLSLLLIAKDSSGYYLSAVGVSGVWQQNAEGLQEIATASTAETNHPGIPKLPPKVLKLAASDAVYFGAPLGHQISNPTPETLMRDAGVNP